MRNDGNDHPFCVDVRESRTAPGRYSWRIMRKGGHVWRSPFHLDDFDEARREAKAKLDALVAEWRASEAVDRAA